MLTNFSPFLPSRLLCLLLIKHGGKDPAGLFLSFRFRVQKWLSFERDHKTGDSDQDTAPELAMLDGCLGFLCSLIGLRTYLGQFNVCRLTKVCVSMFVCVFV